MMSCNASVKNPFKICDLLNVNFQDRKFLLLQLPDDCHFTICQKLPMNVTYSYLFGNEMKTINMEANSPIFFWKFCHDNFDVKLFECKQTLSELNVGKAARGDRKSLRT